MRKITIIILTIFLLWIASFFFIKSIETFGYRNSIATIPIKGVISGGEIFGREIANVDEVIDEIKAASQDKNVKGILLIINSPGGTAVGSSKIANAIRSVKKPVVAYIDEIGTSGAYWVASASDAIVANPMSITGSIGVTGSYLEFSELLEKYGVKYEELTSGKYKEIGGPYKKLSEEERDILLSKLKKIHKHFISDVTKYRNLSKYAIEEISTGVFYLGEEAFKLGLVDYLGDKEFAINVTKNLAGVKEAKLVKYEKRKKRFLSFLERFVESFSYGIGRGLGAALLEYRRYFILY